MESGKHRISLKLMEGGGPCLGHFFGLIRDGAAWDKHHGSTDVWFMDAYTGGLFGNGKEEDRVAVSMTAKS